MKRMIKCPTCGRSRKPGHEKRAGTPKAYNEKCLSYDKVDWKQWKKNEIAKAEKEAREKLEKAATDKAEKEAKEKADKETDISDDPKETSNESEVSTVVSKN